MYAKIFASLYQGTLRGCPDEILVFTNLLAHADSTGIVDKHWRAIAEETGLPRDRVEKAILNLEAPDPESRSPEMDGCRIIKMDVHRAWGWKIVNYGKYRAIRDEEDRRAQNRIAQEKFRNKNKTYNPEVSKSNQSKPRKPESAQAEAEAEAEADKTSSASDDAGYSKSFESFWELYPKRVNKGSAYKAFKRIKATEYPSIRAGLTSKVKCDDWVKDGGKFIPHAATWINARGWEDEDSKSDSQPFDMKAFLRDKVGI